MNVPISRLGAVLASSIILSFFLLTQMFHWRGQQAGALRVPLIELPMEFGDWKGRDATPMDAESHDILKLDQYLRRYYENSKGQGVFVYVGYWEKQSGEHQAAKHSPLMCLPANGWKISSPQSREIAMGGTNGDQHARQLVGLIKDQSLLFYYWFFSGEQTYVDETEALFRIAKEAILRGRSDGGIVELSILLNGSGPQEEIVAQTEATLQDFVRSFVPELDRLVRSEKKAPTT